jgi:hypothetical protein
MRVARGARATSSAGRVATRRHLASCFAKNEGPSKIVQVRTSVKYALSASRIAELKIAQSHFEPYCDNGLCIRPERLAGRERTRRNSSRACPPYGSRKSGLMAEAVKLGRRLMRVSTVQGDFFLRSAQRFFIACDSRFLPAAVRPPRFFS